MTKTYRLTLVVVASPETQLDPFADCDWVTEVRTSLATWTGIPIVKKEIKQSMYRFKGRH